MPSGILTFKEELTRIKIKTVSIFRYLYIPMSTEIEHVSAVLKILSMENIVPTTHFTAHNRKIQVNCLALLVGVLGSLGFASSALAETNYEIKSGDNLSKIIFQNYPNIPRHSHSIIIQDIIKNNPNAFGNNNANSLRLGKVLTLSDQDKIEGLQKKVVTSPPVTPATVEDIAKEAATESVEKEATDATTAEAKISDVVAESSASTSAKDTKNSEADNKTPPDSTAVFEQKIEDLNAEVEQLRTLITKYEADQSDTNSADDKTSDTQALEDLQAQNEQLLALVTKYEAEDETGSADESTGSSSDQASEDLQTENEQLKALVKKYEADAEDSAAQSTSAGNADNRAELATLNAKVEKLTQDNTQLQSDIKTAQTQISASKQAVTAKTSTASVQQDSSPAFWQKFSWILPLIAIFIGLYLLLRLIKRIRNKKATKELKIALSSSPDTVKSNTAAAFSIDGSMLPTASTVEDAPVEEDSLEAGIKIDMAKAYLDLDDSEAAQELLQEAVVEGSTAQRAIAEKLLKKL